VAVPRKFKLLGIEYTVSVISSRDWKRPRVVGYLDAEKCHIQIKKARGDVTEQTFWHEVAHVMLTTMGREDLSSNEEFVDLLASMIHQVLATSEH